MKCLVFGGGECVGVDSNQIEVADWTKKSILKGYQEYNEWTEKELNEWLDECIDMGEDPLSSTFEIVNDNLAQIVEHAYDGGMIYFVRSHTPTNDYEIHRTGFQNYALWCKGNPINITSSLVVVEHWKKQFNIV